jgi:predicted MFS family arabinose efflux permease
LSGVAVGALTAKLLPPERRGEGLGLLGVVSGVPAIVALPAGIWLAGHHLAAAAAATAATVGLLPLVAIRWLPGGREARQTARTGRPRSARSPGRIPSTLASAALLVQAVTATLSRWQAGKHGDRYGHARLLIPALAVAALGMAAMIALGSPVMIFAGMVLFGAGFGVIENATFALTGALILATLPAALRERKAAVPALAGQLPCHLDV